MNIQRSLGVAALASALLSCATLDAPVSTARIASNVSLQSASDAPVALIVSASVDEDGAPTGSWTEELVAGVSITAEVSCYTARGDDIWLGGTIATSSNASFIGRGASLRLRRGADGAFRTSYTILNTKAGCDAAEVPLVGSF
jgi:hypothetical protein